MPKFLLQRFYGYPRIALFVTIFIMLVILCWYSWSIGVIGFFVFAIIAYYAVRAEKTLADELESYISTLTYRIKKVGEDVLSELPIGVVLYDEELKIEWHNKHFLQLINGRDSLIGHRVAEVLPKLEQWIVEVEKEEGTIRYEDLVLHIISRPEERLLYIQDQTEYYQLQQKHRQEKNVFLQIHLDNLDEVTQGLDEQQRTLLISEVTKTLNEWAQPVGIYLKRTNSDKFFGLMSEQSLHQLEENRFDILDKVRDLTKKNKIPVTLSIGVGAGTESLIELGEFSQSSLDLALGRGGDQAAVKRSFGKITFYGGKTNAVEKRTRVRARVISHALRDIIRESDQVFIMGHRGPDLDSIGSAIGVLKAVQVSHKKGFIILERNQETSGIDKLMKHIDEDPELLKAFISPSDALEKHTQNSLLVIVDTHKPSLVMEPKLLDSIARRVVIDHHRRGEEFIAEPLLVYMEPYASSTSELVTELLEYQSKQIEMKKIEATAMLAGIVVDTKSFAFRTGSRTFEAASYLRNHGAETTLVQKLLKEDLDQFSKRSRIVESASLYRDQYAIAVGEVEEKYGSILMAQAADTLLTMNNVVASFVIGEREDGLITISARSLGDINVQVLMEKMEGGGHLTNAATQLEGISVQDALQWLKEVIDEHVEGGVKS